jgi:receptor expression-enhancing protein 5/6
MQFDPQKIRTSIRNTMEEYPTILLNDTLTELEAKVDVPKEFLIFGVGMLVGIVLFAFGGASLLIDVIGFIYPAYASFKAVETDDKEDDTLWLTYWVVYAFFKVFESVADVIVSWLPFYFFIKLGFLIWCYYPGTHGASIIYKKVLRPYLVASMMKLREMHEGGESKGDDDEEEKSDDEKLSVTVLEAMHLRLPASEEEEEEATAYSYNYVLSLGPTEEGAELSSKVRKAISNSARGSIVSLDDEQRVVWDEEHSWHQVDTLNDLQLSVSLVQVNPLDQRPVKVGTGTFPLQTLQPNDKRKTTVTLNDNEGTAVGEVRVVLKFSG